MDSSKLLQELQQIQDSLIRLKQTLDEKKDQLEAEVKKI